MRRSQNVVPHPLLKIYIYLNVFLLICNVYCTTEDIFIMHAAAATAVDTATSNICRRRVHTQSALPKNNLALMKIELKLYMCGVRKYTNKHIELAIRRK